MDEAPPPTMMDDTPSLPDSRPGAAGRPGSRPIAAFGFSKRRAIPYFVMLAVLVAVGFGRVAQVGLSEGWGFLLAFVGLPGILLAFLLRDFMLGGPLLLATEKGLVDRRHSPKPIAWDRIEEAAARNRLFAKGVRLVLDDGERVDIDLSLLDAGPEDILRLIHAAAGQAATRRRISSGNRA